MIVGQLATTVDVCVRGARFRLRFANFRQLVGAKFGAMAKHEINGSKGRARNDFHISNGPSERAGESEARPFDLPDAPELPPLIGAPLLFAIARDPRTIFTYWNIDWSSVFRDTKPADRHVHLRVYCDDAQESSVAVEPMSGSHYLAVMRPGRKYRVEIGFYEPQETWRSVSTSDQVTMPAEGVVENLDVDLATIPFHLSFQRLIDLFRGQNGDALVEIISRLQKRAVSDEDRQLLGPGDWEILRAMDMSVDKFAAGRRAFLNPVVNEKLRKRAEVVLGFGSTSPARPFGESSWS